MTVDYLIKELEKYEGDQQVKVALLSIDWPLNLIPISEVVESNQLINAKPVITLTFDIEKDDG